MTDKDVRVEDIIEIRDEQIDAEAIMRRIKENLQKRRAEARAQGVDFDRFVEGLYQDEDGHYETAIYYNLRRLNALYDRVTVKRYVSPRRIPIVGPLIQRLRAALHDLAIYYVNMQGSQQRLFNEALVHALNALLSDLEQDYQRFNAEIAALRQETDALRERLEALESAKGE